MTDLILASKSAIRATVLGNAGLKFRCQPADIDETILKNQIQDPPTLAQRLSEEKALYISQLNPEAYVIGADQVLAFGQERYSKAKDRVTLKAQLSALRGKTHSLLSGVSLCHDGKILWSHVGQVDLTMWDFDDGFLERYMDQGGDRLYQSVGGYQLENLGSHLFSHIEGDYFTVLGLPLLPLLQKFRDLSLDFTQ